MTNSVAVERRLLQVCTLFAASVAVGSGLAGVIEGARFWDLHGDIFAASHARYFSGLLAGIGIAFWSMIPKIEAHGSGFGLLSAIVVCGGMARLLSFMLDGPPSGEAALILINETFVPIILCLWQRRIAKLWKTA